MSSREPMWYCHECHAEMRPMMMPDPHCASCHGTFVEKIENLADDPRAFRGEGLGGEDILGADDFMFGLHNLLQGATRRGPSPPAMGGAPRSPNGSAGFTIHIDRTGPGNGVRTSISTSPRRSPSTGGTGQIPTLSEFIAQQGGRPGGPDPRGTIGGPLMLQYLLAMLQHPAGRGGPGADLFDTLMSGGADSGRWGDYVFSQEALDQVITQMMENSQAHPVPATEEITEKLPREVLEEGSPLLEKDCAICKDQFSLQTEDPEEQIIVTLPCKHPFHQSCIMPWLKSSGTCPVCRYQLVPQPDHHARGPGTASGSSGQRSPGSGGENGGNGILNGLLNILSGTGSSSSGSNSNAAGTNRFSNQTGPSSPRRRASNGYDSPDLPGGWHEMD